VKKISVLIVTSNEDIASTNIKKGFLEQSKWEEIDTFFNNSVYKNSDIKNLLIVSVNDSKIRHENLEKEILEKLNLKPKLVIFASRHRSKTGEPTLTTHPIGNFGEAKFGGKPRTLVESSPKLMTQLLRIINKNTQQARLYHKVCFEVTHHGPYMNTPTIFAEVGSTEEEWKKQEPADVISKSILELLSLYQSEEEINNEIPVLIGIGGGHYAPRFTDLALGKNVAFGHMIPTYQIDAGNIDEEIFEKAIAATPKVKGVYLHKKELKKSQVTFYKKWFEKKGFPVLSSKDFADL